MVSSSCDTLRRGRLRTTKMSCYSLLVLAMSCYLVVKPFLQGPQSLWVLQDCQEDAHRYYTCSFCISACDRNWMAPAGQLGWFSLVRFHRRKFPGLSVWVNCAGRASKYWWSSRFAPVFTCYLCELAPGASLMTISKAERDYRWHRGVTVGERDVLADVPANVRDDFNDITAQEVQRWLPQERSLVWGILLLDPSSKIHVQRLDNLSGA